MAGLSWFDRLGLQIAPGWTARRLRDKLTATLLARHYEGAAVGRRTQGWRRSAGDGNADLRIGLVGLRENARDLMRNNPYAKAACAAIVNHTVGWGITAKDPGNAFGPLWKQWTESTACDADGRLDFPGLQQQVMRTVVESGEILVRRRIRRPEDGLPIPLQLQLLEPDYLDHLKDYYIPETGGWIQQGVEFNPIGQRIAYWLYPNHPGSTRLGVTGAVFGTAQRIPASEILHVCEPGRPGQVRGASWFANVLLRLKDLDDYEDATLMKQKVAACLAVMVTDLDGTAAPLGVADDTPIPGIDRLEPGMITNVPAGANASVVQPPSVNEYSAYMMTQLHAVATGLGIGYEDLAGDYSRVNFSSARMSRIRHWDYIQAWRWRMLRPQFLDPVWAWANQLAAVAHKDVPLNIKSYWTAPPMPLLEPDKEGIAYQRNIRSGLMSLSDALRERGLDPDTVFKELASDKKTLDKLGVILDIDPSLTTQAGQLQGKALPQKPPPAPPIPPGALPPAGSGQNAAIERLERMVEGLWIAANATGTNGHAPTVNVDARSFVENASAPAPTVQVDARPAPLPEGLVQISQPITVAPSPVTVDARHTMAEGAVVANVAPAPVTVDARTINEPGAINPPDIVVNAPTTVTTGEVTVPLTVAESVALPTGRKVIERDAEGRVTGIAPDPDDPVNTPTVIELDRAGRLAAVQPPKRRGKRKHAEPEAPAEP